MKNEEGFEQLDSLLKELQNLDGREIQNVILPNESIISNTPEKALDRKNYEDFLRTNLAELENLKKIANHFLSDMLNKHLKS